jgi:hypothetical protein
MKSIWEELKTLKEDDDLKVIPLTKKVILEMAIAEFGVEFHVSEYGPYYILPNGEYMYVRGNDGGNDEDDDEYHGNDEDDDEYYEEKYTEDSHQNVDIFLYSEGHIPEPRYNGTSPFFEKETGSIRVYYNLEDGYCNIDLTNTRPTREQYETLRDFVDEVIGNESNLILKKYRANRGVEFDIDENYSVDSVIRKIKSYY